MAYVVATFRDLEPTAACHTCSAKVTAESSLQAPLLWVRGTERRPEVLSVCESCATKNAISALMRFQAYEEG